MRLRPDDDGAIHGHGDIGRSLSTLWGKLLGGSARPSYLESIPTAQLAHFGEWIQTLMKQGEFQLPPSMNIPAGNRRALIS